MIEDARGQEGNTVYLFSFIVSSAGSTAWNILFIWFWWPLVFLLSGDKKIDVIFLLQLKQTNER